jgi:hypothetical protein
MPGERLYHLTLFFQFCVDRLEILYRVTSDIATISSLHAKLVAILVGSNFLAIRTVCRFIFVLVFALAYVFRFRFSFRFQFCSHQFRSRFYFYLLAFIFIFIFILVLYGSPYTVEYTYERIAGKDFMCK